MIIEIEPGNIAVTLGGNGSGSISSNLHQPNDEVYNSCIDGLESLILAHACAGVNITDPQYIEGVRTAIEAIANNA